MNTTNKYSNIGFSLGLISSLLFVTLLIFMKYFYRLFNDFDTIVLVILTLSIGIVSISGFIKEPKTNKKIIGMMLNVGFVLMFLYAIISYVFDL